jgi:peroxisomal 2,4-dienoyl-CoA reductase
MIDTVGTFLMSKYVNKYCFSNGGLIINISASLHYNGTALQSHAGTAKAGVDALTKHMAVELGPKGVRVNGICPGVI